MSLIVYNILLTVLIIIVGPIALVALLLRPRYRVGLGQRLGLLPADITQLAQQSSPFWLHAPSVGELLATRPFLQALKERFPDVPCLVSVQTATAHQAATHRLPEADGVFYSPLDYPLISRWVLRRIRPRMFLFTETEMWPNMLIGLAAQRIPTLLVSGRFSARAQYRYGLLSPVFRQVFQAITASCMQTQDDAQRLITAGADAHRVMVTGNFKVDAISLSDDAGREILTRAGLASRLLLIGASTHASEEDILLQTFRMLRKDVPQLLLLLAPRHPERFPQVEALLREGNYRAIKRSALSASTSPAPADTEVFLLDTLGELASFYAAASLVFVGGSLIPGPGGHSVIEPALAGIPVCFGPHTRNFASIVASLKHAQAGMEIRDAQSLADTALPLFTDVRLQHETGNRARATIEQEQGAVQRTLAIVIQHLSNTASPPS